MWHLTPTGSPGEIDLPAYLRPYIRQIRYTGLGDLAPAVTVRALKEHLTKITLTYTLARDLAQRKISRTKFTDLLNRLLNQKMDSML
jgi:hypothetical protein